MHPSQDNEGAGSEDRADHLINLGITQSKVDKYRRISVTGRVDLQLIQTETAKMKLSVPALRSIGRLIMFVVDKCIPSLNTKDIFYSNNAYELSYLRWFGQQLLVTDEDGLSRFNIPAISILINGILRPHCDDLNPLDYDKDFTFSLFAMIQLSRVKCAKMRRIAEEKFPNGIPLCLVAYRRRVIQYFLKYLNGIDNYVSSNHLLKSGRQSLVNLFNKTQCANDYQGFMFKSKDYSHIESMFATTKKGLFRKPMMITQEAVDKMVSNILNINHLQVFIEIV